MTTASASVGFLQAAGAEPPEVVNLKNIEELDARLAAAKATVAQQTAETATFKDKLIQFQAQFQHGAADAAASDAVAIGPPRADAGAQLPRRRGAEQGWAEERSTLQQELAKKAQELDQLQAKCRRLEELRASEVGAWRKERGAPSRV